MRRSKPKLLCVITAGLGMLAAGAPAQAHHSFAAEYDVKQPVTLKGVVTRIAWENPHTYIYIDVKDESGKVVNWGFEGYPPNTLRRTGWTKEMLKVGDTVSVTGWRAKDASNQIAGREVTLPDGRKVFVGPAAQ